MSDNNSSLLPVLIDKLFQKIEITCAVKKKLSEDCLLELHSIFGATLERALNVLDNTKITLYKPTSGIRELLEVNGTNGQVYKFFPNINYCPCIAFKYYVVTTKSQYTCKHVLAAKIGLLLDKVEIQILTDDQFDFLIKEVQNQEHNT